MTTTAKREEIPVFNGQKRWIGNATWCDVSIIWARDLADNQVKVHRREQTTPGFSVEKIEHKIALKVVQNGQITLKDAVAGGEPPAGRQLVPRHRPRAADDALHGGLASTGIQMGAFEATLKYTQERLQFGKPIASFQMVQDLLAKMLANVTACQCLMVRLAQMMTRASSKTITHRCARRSARLSRETVAWGRELLGGNGIVADLQRRALLRRCRSALFL
jgi:glutaryl-CoA dehydrogenase